MFLKVEFLLWSPCRNQSLRFICYWFCFPNKKYFLLTFVEVFQPFCWWRVCWYDVSNTLKPYLFDWTIKHEWFCYRKSNFLYVSVAIVIFLKRHCTLWCISFQFIVGELYRNNTKPYWEFLLFSRFVS